MVRVVSCRFLRLSCSEDDHPLFRRYYARSNRERGVKLLRCFPHCCPEHVQRCYCGSSIHVQVTFASELPPAVQANLVVCARFEPSRVVPLWPTNLAATQGYEGDEDLNLDHERKIQPGELVSLPESVLYAKTRQTKQSMWVRADREGASKQTTKNATLYVLNNHRFPKWLYSYDSSVTRTQREMTHHLVVYVCQITGSRSQLGEIDATVLARHESPAFSLISYRRSGNNASDAGCDLPAVEVSSGNQFAAVEVDTPSPSEDMETDSYDKTLPAAQLRHIDTKHSPQPQWRLQTEEKPSSLQQEKTVEADEFLWQQEAEAREPGFREKAQHLLILWRFLQHVSLRDLHVSPSSVETYIHPYWLRAAAALRGPPVHLAAQLESVVASFLSNLFENESARATSPYTDRNQATIRASGRLFLSALASRSIQNLFRQACQLQSGAMDRDCLRKRFVSLAVGLYNSLNDMLGACGQPQSLATLMDDILSVIYGRTSFSVLRDEVSSLLLARETPSSLFHELNEAFRVFTAQAHESSMALMGQQRQTNQLWTDNKTLHNAWGYRWLLDPGSVHLIALDSFTKRDARQDASLVAVAQLVREFGCVDITVNRGESICMSLQAALALDGVVTAPMELVLDGRMRRFRVLPSGTSSVVATAGGWSVGDYEASLSEDGYCLSVHFFAFVEENPRISRSAGRESLETKIRRVTISLVLEQPAQQPAQQEVEGSKALDSFIIVHGTVYGSIFSRSDGLGRVRPKLGAMSSGDRSAVWNELKWAPLFEVQAGYVAL
ncbi:hypothetical protein V7S43_002354 [Phytophthora oleae]|uniref:Uncharacterized protein n=1 Tax=Phytophthora oleae TaxID=2107226 RepID=A0ABD3G5E4_9STRA